MGKKGSWFSAIKRVFSHSPNHNLKESQMKGAKEKKKNGFLSHFGEPSSIEKILVDAERENKIIFRPPMPPDEPKTPAFVPTRAESPTVASPRRDVQLFDDSRLEPTLTSHNASPTEIRPTVMNHDASASKIQAAYRGYTERKSLRAVKGLVRLQGVVRGNNVQQQTMNAMKQMQIFVRVQMQIQSRRTQMMSEDQSLKHQSNNKIDKWLERQPPPTESQNARNGHITPHPRLTPEQKTRTWPQSSHYKQHPLALDSVEAVTPKSTRSTFTPRWKQLQNPTRGAMKDDDSLISCPIFSVPNYMTPTISAKAKSRAYSSNPQDRFHGSTTPTSVSKRRLSLPSDERQHFLQANDNMSVDSRLSLPVGAARKPFNRFV